MSNFIKSILGVVLVTLIIYVIAVTILGYFNVSIKGMNFKFLESPSRTLLRIEDLSNIDSLDILFLGSSRAFMGFDTRLLNEAGYSCFNLGSSAQTPVQTNYLLTKHLVDIHPRLVVYEVYYEGFSNSGVESAVDVLSSDKVSLESLRMAIRLKQPTVYNALIFSWIRQLFGYRPEFIQSRGGYISGSGYVERNISHWTPVSYSSAKTKVNEFQWEAFLENIKILTDRKIPFLLVQAPIPPVRYRSVMNMDSIHSILSEQGAFIAFNEILELNDSLYFEDDSHLNVDGVKVFNDALIELLPAYLP